MWIPGYGTYILSSNPDWQDLRKSQESCRLDGALEDSNPPLMFVWRIALRDPAGAGQLQERLLFSVTSRHPSLSFLSLTPLSIAPFSGFLAAQLVGPCSKCVDVLSISPLLAS